MSRTAYSNVRIVRTLSIGYTSLSKSNNSLSYTWVEQSIPVFLGIYLGDGGRGLNSSVWILILVYWTLLSWTSFKKKFKLGSIRGLGDGLIS